MPILDRFRIDDKVALVTGAGRGIGRATAIALAENGADVALAARSEDQLEAVAEEIRKLGRRALVVPTNAAKTENLEAFDDHFGGRVHVPFSLFFAVSDAALASRGGEPKRLAARFAAFRDSAAPVLRHFAEAGRLVD